MKIKNGNLVPNNKENKPKTKLYHKVAIWNKESSHMASDQEKFPVILAWKDRLKGSENSSRKSREPRNSQTT